MGRHRTSGFTLTELMTVMAIGGILVSIATISMAEYISQAKLRTTIYSIDADIRRARWIARSTSSTCFIKFDTAANSYTINGTDLTKIPEGVWFGVDSSVTGSPGSPGTMPPADGISFGSSSNPNTLIYYVTGHVVPGGTVYITDGKQTMAVRVATTGRPKIWQSSGSKWTAI